MISDGENFIQNKCNKWMKYRNLLPIHKNANMGSSSVHLNGVDLMDIANSRLIIAVCFDIILYNILWFFPSTNDR